MFGFTRSPAGSFIVMERVEGTSFAELIATAGLLPPARALGLLRPVCDAIEYAHASGVIHRDLKPASLVVDASGRPCVTDLGAAKLLTDASGLTRDGSVVGTAEYMPPEQIVGQPLTPAADIYALGVTLYEMCTGRRPFEDDDRGQLFRKIYHEAPAPPSAHYPALPAEVDALVLRCLAKRPADRFSSARELGEALDRALAAAGGAPAPAPDFPGAGVPDEDKGPARLAGGAKLERRVVRLAELEPAAAAAPPAARAGAAAAARRGIDRIARDPGRAAIALGAAGFALIALGSVLGLAGSAVAGAVAVWAGSLVWACGTSVLLVERARRSAPQAAEAEPAAGPSPAASPRPQPRARRHPAPPAAPRGA
jgi:serine/threonine-protein kinase